MTFDSPSDLKPNDVVDVVTDIRRHDIVCWERVGPNALIMRALSPEEAATYTGRRFQVEKGDELGTLRYIEVVAHNPLPCK